LREKKGLRAAREREDLGTPAGKLHDAGAGARPASQELRGWMLLPASRERVSPASSEGRRAEGAVAGAMAGDKTELGAGASAGHGGEQKSDRER
jgi:Ser/Thr protein kinase RdoA (MazF antagonist)